MVALIVCVPLVTTVDPMVRLQVAPERAEIVQVSFTKPSQSQFGCGKKLHCSGKVSGGQTEVTGGVIGARGEQNFARTSNFTAANT